VDGLSDLQVDCLRKREPGLLVGDLKVSCEISNAKNFADLAPSPFTILLDQ